MAWKRLEEGVGEEGKEKNKVVEEEEVEEKDSGGNWGRRDTGGDDRWGQDG